MEKCAICGEEIVRESPIFYFPKFGLQHPLRKYFGAVHVKCIRALPHARDISAELRKAYLEIFNEKSDTPIAAHNGNILIKDCIASGNCFEVFDFDDFVTFFVPEKSLLELKSLAIGSSISLGVQNLQKLFRKPDGTMNLEIKRPPFIVDLPLVSFDKLVQCLDAAERYENNSGK